MIKRVRPIGYDDRLSVVDHLEELRGRLFICLGVLGGAFGICFWQSGRIEHLLNRPLDSPVAADTSLMSTTSAETAGAQDTAGRSLPGFPPLTATSVATGTREEFARLKSYQQILRSNLRYDRNYLIPKLNAFYDVGYQGFGFHFNGTQFYQLVGVNLIWPLFRANDNKYRIRQACIDIDAIDDQYRNLTQQVTLEEQVVVNNYQSAIKALQALADEAASAREAYRLAERRFDEGRALQIELIDARNQFTSAEIHYSLGRLDVLNKAADLERVTAAYKF